jgi:DNA invertase Pin-like site-specific DNA recombinase
VASVSRPPAPLPPRGVAVRRAWTASAAAAEKERSLIADRTKVSLQAAKDRGQRLGNPNLDAVRGLAAARTREISAQYAANTLPIVREIQASGVTTLRAIAAALIARGIPTARGGQWNAMQVLNLLKRGAASAS